MRLIDTVATGEVAVFNQKGLFPDLFNIFPFIIAGLHHGTATGYCTPLVLEIVLQFRTIDRFISLLFKNR